MHQRKWTVKNVNWHDLVFTSLFSLKMNQKPSSKKSFHFPLISLNIRLAQEESHTHIPQKPQCFYMTTTLLSWKHTYDNTKSPKYVDCFPEWEKQHRENSQFCQANICLLDCFICWSTETLSHHVSAFRESNLAKLIISDDWARLLWPGQLSWQWVFI